MDPVGCVTADYIQSVAEGLEPSKTVNEFLDHGDYDYGTQVFGRAGHRYGDSTTDKVLLFKSDNFGVDGPILLTRQLKDDAHARANDMNLLRRCCVSTIVWQESFSNVGICGGLHPLMCSSLGSGSLGAKGRAVL